MVSREEILLYVKETYGVLPDYPWRRDPESAVLRHENNRKWFALLMKVAGNRLGLPGDRDVEIMDLKCDPLLIGSLRGSPGVLPAYHMSKEHWVTILLDGPLPRERIFGLIDLSFDLTQ